MKVRIWSPHLAGYGKSDEKKKRIGLKIKPYLLTLIKLFELIVYLELPEYKTTL